MLLVFLLVLTIGAVVVGERSRRVRRAALALKAIDAELQRHLHGEASGGDQNFRVAAMGGALSDVHLETILAIDTAYRAIETDTTDARAAIEAALTSVETNRRKLSRFIF